MLVDSHCHLDFADFAAERDAVIDRAADAGIEAMVTIATRLDAFPAVRAIAEAHPAVWCSVGAHPHEAADHVAVTGEALAALSRHPRVVGIGETGLDFHYELSPRADQERVFRAHIAAARATGLPLIVHAREADAEIARILGEERPPPGAQLRFTAIDGHRFPCFATATRRRQLADLALHALDPGDRALDLLGLLGAARGGRGRGHHRRRDDRRHRPALEQPWPPTHPPPWFGRDPCFLPRPRPPAPRDRGPAYAAVPGRRPMRLPIPPPSPPGRATPPRSPSARWAGNQQARNPVIRSRTGTQVNVQGS